jgi:histidinol dehydrogenase
MLSYDLSRMSEAQLKGVMTRAGVDVTDAMVKAEPIIQEVMMGGDKALLQLAKKLDKLKGNKLTVPEDVIRSAKNRVPKKLLSALAVSKNRIGAFHEKQDLKPFEYKDECGMMGQRVVPLRRVGVYVPGGSADYVSTVLMACIPARIAGVHEIAICTPGRDGEVPDSILAAADLCGVHEVHPVGGAHAIAAMAYGTESVKKVQKIVGPGGAVVSAAKLLVRNDCEIDFLAGPSEILVIADQKASPEMIASDMLAQLEHDPLARAILVSDSKNLIADTMFALKKLIEKADRSEIIAVSSEDGAIFIQVKDLRQATEFSNAYAPEHLLIDTYEPWKVFARVENAGSVFVGRYSSVVFGDYCTGTNHILPTKGAASMKSALAVYDFLKIIPYQSVTQEGAQELADVVEVIAKAEGLDAHADAAQMRKKKGNR